MKILMVSSEMTPFIKTGGLADVVGSLPGALRARGHDVRVVIPRYSDIDGGKHNLQPFHGPMGVWMGNHQEWCSVLSATGEGDTPVYLVEHNGFFDRWGLYHDQWRNDYQDNPRRFGFLARAALQICIDLGWYPDVVHAHDWQAALAPAYVKLWGLPGFGECGTLLTIHNIAYQGIYSKHNYEYLGLGWENFRSDLFESYDAINFLKGGIGLADVVNTVSPTYAEETRHTMGEGLEPNLRAKGDNYFGILNGVDYGVWSPETDKLIPANYSADDLSGKQACKRALQERFGLDQDPGVALLGVVGRLVEQKGLNLLAEILQGLVDTMHLQVVLLGSGDKGLEHHFGWVNGQYPGRVGTYFGFSEELAHLIEAGSDFFIMPSVFEPCGLNQLYSLRYGTLPIVRATGGLNDTVENYDEATGGGTGFKFHEPSGHALYYAIGWAISTYYDRPRHMQKMIREAMSRRFSWDESATEYERAYERAVQARRGVYLVNRL